MTFASGEDQPFSLNRAITFYSFSYGIKIIFFIIGSVYLWKTNRKLFIVLLGIIIPTFILVNNIQLSPSSIYENHKWLRPMNVIVDIIVGAIIFIAFFRRKILVLATFGISMLFFLTISGIIELMPFLNSKPSKVYAAYPSPIMTAIWHHTPPQATFIGSDTREILLAGRKVFLGKTLGGNFRLKKRERRTIIKAIYNSTTIAEVCSHTNRHGITHIEFTSEDNPELRRTLQQLPHFTSSDKYNREVVFIDVLHGCNTPAAMLQ